jgi:hypothetical protein
MIALGENSIRFSKTGGMVGWLGQRTVFVSCSFTTNHLSARTMDINPGVG